MIGNSKASLLLFASVLALIPLSARAGEIATRAELHLQLGSALLTEDLEGYVFAPGTTWIQPGAIIDSSLTINGQGPGLVHDNIRFLSTLTNPPSGAGLTLDRQTDYQLTSTAIRTDGNLIIDFVTPVTHVGFDFFWYNTAGSPPIIPNTIEVYGPDDTSIIQTAAYPVPEAPVSAFFGYTDMDGIGKIVMAMREPPTFVGVSPLVDNIDFGAVPEPGSVTLLVFGFAGLGLAIRFKRPSPRR